MSAPYTRVDYAAAQPWLYGTGTETAYNLFVGGSMGVVCVGGAVGRFVAPGQILQSTAAGVNDLAIDLSMLPTPNGPIAATPGSTLHFQHWHRDTVGGAGTSNLTDGFSITFE